MQICVLNASTLITNAEVHLATRAIAHQLRYDVAPIYGLTPAHVAYKSVLAHVEPGSIIITVFDDSDQEGALGWHTEEADEVQYGKVFAKPVLDNGGAALTGDLSISSVLSHEVLEAFADPRCNLWAQASDSVLVAYENCDPVESDSYPVTVSGQEVMVSNFVTPDWFDPQATGPFDFLKKLSKPFSMTKGGYITYMQNGKIKQTYGEHVPEWKKTAKARPVPRGQVGE